MSSIQEGPEDAIVYSFRVEKGACSGSLARIESPNESTAQAQSKSILQTPGCRTLVDDNVVIYICFSGPGTAAADQCSDAAAKLFAK